MFLADMLFTVEKHLNKHNDQEKKSFVIVNLLRVFRRQKKNPASFIVWVRVALSCCFCFKISRGNL